MTKALLLVGILFALAPNTSSQTPAGPQTTTGNCSPIFNGNNNVNNCNVPPGDRRILMSDARTAIAILEQVSPKPKVQFTVIGGTREINTFANNVSGLFAEAHWQILVPVSIGQLSVNGMSHGAGVACYGTAGSPAFEAAKSALAAAGYPCRIEDSTFPRDPNEPVTPDVRISIGSRFVSEE